LRFVAKLVRHSVPGLIRLACALALLGLAIMSFSIVSGRPLPVVLAMSIGHTIGIASFACFLLAVLIDAIRRDGAVARDSTPEIGTPKSPE
jgi:hypothetical protein